MKKEKVFFEEESTLKKIQNYFLSPYERMYDGMMNEEEKKGIEISTGPNCI